MRVVLPGAAAIAAVTLSGCQFPPWGSPLSPASGSPSAAATPGGGAGSGSPTASTAPTAAAHKATGSLVFYQMPVSTKMTGTCVETGPLTATLADHSNDFYSTVDLTVVLDPAQHTVTSVTGSLGEDSEGFTRKLSYSATTPGSSAAVSGSGPTYQISGVLSSQETRYSKTTTTTTLPFSLKLTCQAS